MSRVNRGAKIKLMPHASRTFNKKRLTRNVSIGLISVILVILLTVNRQPPTVFAQSPLEKAQNDYSSQLQKYNQAKENYITAKANYNAFKTAASKNDAFVKTRDYLTQTNFLITNYLLVVKEYANQLNWESSSFKKDDTFKPIDDEVNYLQDNWHQFQKTTTLEDLPILANDLSKHLENSTNPITNKTLATYEVVKTEYLVNNFNQLSQKLIDFANTKVKENNRSIVNNWLSEINIIKRETDAHIIQSKADLEKVITDSPNQYQIDQVIQNTKLTQDELLKSRDLFKEILRII